MTADAFDKGMALLLASFPNLKPDTNTLKAWRALLGDLDDQAFLRAVLMFCRCHKDLFPGTGLVATLLDYARPDDAPLAVEAWAEVIEQVHRIGYYGIPKFTHERIEQTVRAIGWVTLCNSEEIAIERAHFLKCYEQLTKRETTHRLAGLSASGMKQLAELTKGIGHQG